MVGTTNNALEILEQKRFVLVQNPESIKSRGNHYGKGFDLYDKKFFNPNQAAIKDNSIYGGANNSNATEFFIRMKNFEFSSALLNSNFTTDEIKKSNYQITRSPESLVNKSLLKEKYPDLQFLVPLVNEKRRQQFEEIKAQIAPDLDMHLIDGKARQVMIAAEATLLASGTAALEAMLCKSPMVVGYRMKPFTYFLAKRLVKTKYISLPNLLADEMLVPEMIQEDCEPQKLAEQLSQYLGDDESAVKSRSVLIQRFTELHKLIQCDADSQAAQAVIDLLEQKHD